MLRTLEAEHGLRLNPMQNVACGIARQPAGSGIAPHCDGNVLGLTCHLGLQVPEAGCWIEVGGERRQWEERKVLLMDTTFVHQTGNDGESDRYVLMLNVLRPGVSEADTAALQRHLSAPPMPLDAFNAAYVWLSSAASAAGTMDDGSEQPMVEKDAAVGRGLASASRGDVFACVSPVTEVGPSQLALEVAPSCWLPLRHTDETKDGLAEIVTLDDGQAFKVLAPTAFRELPSHGAAAVEGASPAPAVGDVVSPDLGILDEDGYVAWVGFWEQGVASLLRPLSAPREGDELDVPYATLRQHLSLLREPLQTHARWLPYEAADGSPVLVEAE